jgi:hypothetical protein
MSNKVRCQLKEKRGIIGRTFPKSLSNRLSSSVTQDLSSLDDEVEYAANVWNGGISSSLFPVANQSVVLHLVNIWPPVVLAVAAPPHACSHSTYIWSRALFDDCWKYVFDEYEEHR